MSETTTTVPMNDAELFQGAIAAEPPAPETPAAEAPQGEASQVTEGQPRDPETGQFAPKDQVKADAAPTQQQPETKPDKPAEPAKPQDQQDAQIPSWRARELREQREAEQKRADDAVRENQALRQQMAQVNARLNELTQKPKEAPDLFVDPDAYIGNRVEPIRQQVGQELGLMREGFSRIMAIEKHGEEAVQSAYDELDRQMKTGTARYDFARIMQSPHPFGELVKWHKQQQNRQMVGDDPNAWFEKTLEERMKDPAQQAKMLERIRGTVSNPPNGKAPVVQLPPSLNRVASAAPASDDNADDSDAGLYRYATR